MEGWIKLHRSILNNWIWHDERYFRWWIIILLTVNYREMPFTAGGKKYVCKPGESFNSIETWMGLFRCSKPSVVKFLKLLETDGMIERKTVGRGNRRKHLLTVVNWDKYQQTETETFTERKPKTLPKENPNVPSNKNEKKYEFIEEEFYDVFNYWLEYKKERKESYKSERSLKTAYNHLKELSGNNPDKAKKIINQSIAGNWAGLFELKNDNHAKNKQSHEEFDDSRFRFITDAK